MSHGSTRLGVSVGVTNTRLNAAKRGIAPELAARLALATHSPVCLVAADPNDRDLAHRMAELIRTDGASRTQVNRGPHSLQVAFLPRRRLCAITVSDAAGLEAVLPELQHAFRYVIIDAPSRIGFGVGISHVLLPWLDVLLVASEHGAGALSETRTYLRRLDDLPAVRDVDVRVVPSGHPFDSELSHQQIARRLSGMPTLGRVPQLWGRIGIDGAHGTIAVDDGTQPIVQWILEHPKAQRLPTPDPRALLPSLYGRIASKLYEES